MGLDSYLYATRFVSHSSWSSEKEQKAFKSIARVMNGNKFVDTTEYALQFGEVKMQVAYWRKANAVHKYFVDHCGGGKDECQDIPVSRDALKNLLERSETVLKDLSRASELLPTKSGFFFGSTDYDEWYEKDLEHTIDVIGRVLKNSPSDWEFIYRASW